MDSLANFKFKASSCDPNLDFESISNHSISLIDEKSNNFIENAENNSKLNSCQKTHYFNLSESIDGAPLINLESNVCPYSSSTSPTKSVTEYSSEENWKKFKLKSPGRKFWTKRSRPLATDFCSNLSNNSGKPMNMLVAHEIKTRDSNSSFKDDILQNESSKKMSSFQAEDRAVNLRENLNSSEWDKENYTLHKLQNQYVNNQIKEAFKSSEATNSQKLRSLLRERFLRLLIHLSDGRNCTIKTFENPDLFCKIKAFHPNFETILIKQSYPNVPNDSLIGFKDILSMQFYNLNLRSILK